MTTSAPQTAAPATQAPAQAPAAPASQPAPATSAPARDPYGEKRVSLDKLPVVGHLNRGKFTPASAETDKPAQDSAATEAAAADNATDKSGQPATEDGKPATQEPGVLKAENGKTFKDAAELLATYNASAPEAKRLDSENKTLKLTNAEMQNQMTELRDSLLKMQEYIMNATHAPVVPEKYQGKTEAEMLAEMTEPEKLDYLLDKREWKKKVDTFKAKLETAKTESEAIATKTKAEIARVEQVMAQDKTKYPDFEALSPLRAEILQESPHLANRPDTPYLTYYIARGIMADMEAREKARLETESRARAGTEAAGAAASAGAGAPAQAGKSSAPKNDGLRGLVKAAKALKGSF